MKTRASVAPSSARATASTCDGLPVPASTIAASAPGSSQVLLPVGPVHSEGLSAGIRIGCIASPVEPRMDAGRPRLDADANAGPVAPPPLEEILQAKVEEVAVGEPADRVLAAAREPPDRALD